MCERGCVRGGEEEKKECCVREIECVRGRASVIKCVCMRVCVEDVGVVVVMVVVRTRCACVTELVK